LVPSDMDSGSNVKMSGPEILKYRLIYLLTRNMSCDVAAYLVLYSLMYYLYFLPIAMLITLRLGYEFLVILPIIELLELTTTKVFKWPIGAGRYAGGELEVGRIGSPPVRIFF